MTVTLPATTPSGSLEPGDVLDGKYRLGEVLGRGGNGIVFSAWHDVIEQPVAIKVLLRDPKRNPKSVERFIREARAAAKLETPHVPKIYDVGTLDDGTPFMVMERLEGEDLATVLRRRGPLPVSEAVSWMLQALEAVTQAHALRIVHRDLKPANLFFARQRQGGAIVKVLDFGISKDQTDAPSHGSDLTATGDVIGTPRYMAPEQLMDSSDIDERVDVWSLGITLYELLTGRAPFQGRTFTALSMAIVSSDVPAMSTHRPDVPAELEAVVMRCLEKDPVRRYATAIELRDGLHAVANMKPRGRFRSLAPILVGFGLVIALGIGVGALSAAGRKQTTLRPDPPGGTTASAVPLAPSLGSSETATASVVASTLASAPSAAVEPPRARRPGSGERRPGRKPTPATSGSGRLDLDQRF